MHIIQFLQEVLWKLVKSHSYLVWQSTHTHIRTQKGTNLVYRGADESLA